MGEKQLVERTAFDGQVSLHINHHDSKLCKEFIVTSPKFRLGRWFLLTSVFNTLGFWLELHTQDSRIMSVVIALLILTILVKLHLKVKRESLLVVASIGVQITTTFALGRTKATFYDMSRVEDIVINEGITMHRVIYYLCLLLRDEKASSKEISHLVPFFQHSWPSLHCLTLIYQEAQDVLHRSMTSR